MPSCSILALPSSIWLVLAVSKLAELVVQTPRRGWIWLVLARLVLASLAKSSRLSRLITLIRETCVASFEVWLTWLIISITKLSRIRIYSPRIALWIRAWLILLIS